VKRKAHTGRSSDSVARQRSRDLEAHGSDLPPIPFEIHEIICRIGTPHVNNAVAESNDRGVCGKGCGGNQLAPAVKHIVVPRRVDMSVASPDPDLTRR